MVSPPNETTVAFPDPPPPPLPASSSFWLSCSSLSSGEEPNVVIALPPVPPPPPPESDPLPLLVEAAADIDCGGRLRELMSGGGGAGWECGWYWCSFGGGIIIEMPAEKQ